MTPRGGGGGGAAGAAGAAGVVDAMEIEYGSSSGYRSLGPGSTPTSLSCMRVEEAGTDSEDEGDKVPLGTITAARELVQYLARCQGVDGSWPVSALQVAPLSNFGAGLRAVVVKHGVDTVALGAVWATYVLWLALVTKCSTVEYLWRLWGAKAAKWLGTMPSGQALLGNAELKKDVTAVLVAATIVEELW